jgi:hypothetical protein
MRKYAAATALAIALITMLTLAGSASLTPANASHGMGGIGCRAGTPCVIRKSAPGYSTEIIEPPQNGTAVLRADGSIYNSPRPGFTGRDRMRVRLTNRSACQLPEKLQADHSEFLSPNPRCHSTRGIRIFVE